MIGIDLNRFQFLFLILVQLSGLYVHAQYPNSVAAVSAFNSINSKPQILHLKKKYIKVPSGGHLQGIQALSDSTYVITASSGTYSYYLTASNQELKSIQKINDDPYRHAGGCQVYDHKLVIGVEDNRAKDKSDIVLISFDSTVHEIKRNIITHRSGTFKRSTAGAVGFTRSAKGQYILAVGDWDSRDIDFYISRKDDETAFDSLSSFHTLDAKWCSYQAINLMTDSTGKLYLIGLGLDGLHNRADLFEVNISSSTTDMKLLGTRNFTCKSGAIFRYGSGISITREGKLIIYSCARNVQTRTAVNVFR